MNIAAIQKMAEAEAKASPLPGIKDGPANAYVHLIGVAEVRRRYGKAAADVIAYSNELIGELIGSFPPGGMAAQSRAALAMDLHNNVIAMGIGARAARLEDVIRWSRLAILNGAEHGGVGSADTPMWLGHGEETKDRPNAIPAMRRPARWPAAPVNVSGHDAASERFRFMGGDSPRRRQAALPERLGDLPTREWSHKDMRGVIASTPHLNATHPQHRKWRDLVHEYFVEHETADRSRRLASDDDSCGGSTEVQGYTRQGPNGPVQVRAHGRTVGCD